MIKRILILFCLLMIFSKTGFAEILFDAKFTVDISENSMDVGVLISNVGKEDALKVYPSLQWQNQTKTFDTISYIAFGGAYEWHHQFEFEKKRLFAGTYPLFLRIYYLDANNYPFSMAVVTLVEFSEQTENIPKMIDLDNLSEPKKNICLKITLRDALSSGISGKCLVYGPAELEVLQPVRDFTLAPNETDEFVFDINNSGALPGNRYQVFGIMEIENTSGHITQIVSQTVTVPDDDAKILFILQIIVGVIFIITLYCITLFYEFKRNGRKQ